MSVRSFPVICLIIAVLATGLARRSQADAALDGRQLAPANPPQTQMTEVERLTAEGDWDRAIELLTGIIEQLTASERSEDTDRQLVLAYERRAMARLQTGDEANARIDFAALLQRDPNYVMAAASPGLTGLLSEVRKSTLGLLELAVRPADATITLERTDASTTADITPRAIGTGTTWLRPGIYQVTVRRPGHGTVTDGFTAGPGTAERRVIALQRTSAALFVSTSPAGVRVLVNGELRGVTEAGSGNSMSLPLVIDGLEPRDTPHKVRFEKDCFVPAGDTFLLESLDMPVGTDGPDPEKVGIDRTYEVALKPAFGRLEVLADQPDASVWIGGHHRGAAAQPIVDVCEGIHLVDVRGPAGRFTKQITIEYAKTMRIEAPLVPTFALIPPAAGAPIDGELSARLVNALRASRGVRLIVPDAGELEASKGTDAALLTRRLDVQGVATAARIAPDADGHDVEVTWTASGASRADVTRLRLADTSSVERLVERFDATIPVSRTSIGVDAVDVLRVDGAVVSAVDPTGPANGVIKPGDVIVGIGPAAVAGVADLSAVLAASNGPTVNVRIRDRNEVVPVNVVTRPMLVSMNDPGVLFNETVTELRARLARLHAKTATPDAAESERLRVNLGVSLMAVGAWTEAETLLKDIGGANSGIPAGTVE